MSRLLTGPLRIGSATRKSLPPAALLAIGVAGAGLGGWWVVHPVAERIGLSALAIVAMLVLAATAQRQLLYWLAGWLVALGLLRRLVPDGGSGSNSIDPLLVVFPVAMGALVLIAARGGAFRKLSPLAWAVALLSGLVVLGGLNPAEGSLTASLAGMVLALVPMLAFWVGRGLVTDRMFTRLFVIMAVLAIPAAAYGIAQTLVGFSAWDARWIQRVLPQYTALGVGGSIRPFGTFSAAVEYAYFLAIGLAVCLAFGLRHWRAPVALAAGGLLAYAVVLSGSRSVVVTAILALGLTLCAWRRLPLGVGALGGLLAVGLLFGFASRLGNGLPMPGASVDPASALLTHQLGGLGDPLNPKTSTLGIHTSVLLAGLGSVVRHPIGVGSGALSATSAKLGGFSAGTDLDLSNAAVALGVPGVLAYLAVAALGLRALYRLASGRNESLSLLGLFVAVLVLNQWLAGGLYAVSYLPWLIFGWADRSLGAAIGGGR